MSGLAIIGIFFLFMALGIPIAITLGASSVVYMLIFVDIPPLAVVQQMMSGVDKFMLMAIPFFIIAGGLMEQGGISERIITFSKSMVASRTGGLAAVTTVASMIFAAMTGAGAATVAAIGGIMIPAMREEGYDADFACALQATGGIFGPLIPPSILMVLYGVSAGVSVADMLLGGVVPGLMMGGLVIMTAIWLCRKKGYRGQGRFSVALLLKTGAQAFWAVLSPVIILGGIYTGMFTPTEAAAVACLYSLVIGLFVYRELKLARVLRVLASSTVVAGGILLIVGATQAFGWVLTREQIPQQIAVFFQSLTTDPSIFLLCTGAFLLVAGCFLDPVPAVMLFVPILCPAAQQYGISLLHFGVVMVVALVIGLVTPPVGINIFVASSIGKRPVHSIIPHLPPFILTLIVGLLIVIFFPQLSTFLPNMAK